MIYGYTRDGQPAFGFCNAAATAIGKKAWVFAKLQPSRARKRINAT